LTARGILHTKRTVFNIRGDCLRTARHPRSVNAAYANRSLVFRGIDLG
jgi:hypothetical protein